VTATLAVAIVATGGMAAVWCVCWDSWRIARTEPEVPRWLRSWFVFCGVATTVALVVVWVEALL
jgi:hypothetical protein